MKRTFPSSGESDSNLPADAASQRRLRRSMWRSGLIAAVVVGGLFASPLAAASFLVLFFCVGLLWRPNDPILPWCVAFQWLQITGAQWYSLVVGEPPGRLQASDEAVWVSLAGLTALSLGLLAGRDAAASPEAPAGEGERTAIYSIPRLGVLVSVLYSVEWFTAIRPNDLSFVASQVIQRFFDLRMLFLFMLLLAVLRQRRQYAWCLVALAIYWLPTLSSPMSWFSGLFIVTLLAFACEWNPVMAPGAAKSGVGRKQLAGVVGVASVLLLLAIVWTGAVKPVWRAKVLRGEVTGSRSDVAMRFLETTVEEFAKMEWATGIDALAQRLSSGVYYFGLVLSRVPSILPHEDGAFTQRALEHVLKPRFLFPDKPIIDSSSWIVRRYAGVNVAGAESATSVGLTYMGEFYIDYAMPGMFVALFMYGGLVGLGCRALRRVAPSYDVYRGTLVVLLAFGFHNYEGELLKDLGGMLQAFLVYWPLLWVFGKPVHRALLPAHWPVVNRKIGAPEPAAGRST